MKKLSPDGNMQKVLSELENRPALLKRCQTLYLERLIKGKSYQELAQTFGVSLSTAFKYVQAYKTVAERYSDAPSITGVIEFCQHEISKLLKRREEAETHRDYKDLTGEIRHYKKLESEISGLVRKGTDININFINNTINVITNELPTLLEQHLPKEIVNNILLALAQKLEESTQGS